MVCTFLQDVFLLVQLLCYLEDSHKEKVLFHCNS